MINAWTYPTEQDWEVMMDNKKSFTINAYALARRLNLIGCSHPTLPPAKCMLVLLMAVLLLMPCHCFYLGQLPVHTTTACGPAKCRPS